MQTLILCGGLGTRLRPLVNDRPKSMAPVAGRPFIEYLLLQLRQYGFRDIILCVGYQAGCVKDYFGSGEPWQVRLRYSEEREPLGTAGALKLAEPLIASTQALVLNGDSLFAIDLQRLAQYHEQKRALATVALASLKNTQRYGSVEVNAQGEVVRFLEKAEQRSGWINGGIYLFRRDLFEHIPFGQRLSLEQDIFPLLIGTGFYGLAFSGSYLVDIGVPEAYLQVQAEPERLLAAVGVR